MRDDLQYRPSAGVQDEGRWGCSWARLTLPYVRHSLPQELLAEVYGLFVFEGVVGGAYRLVEVVVVRWSLRRPVWMRLPMV